MMNKVIDKLLNSKEPSIRFKTMVNVLDENVESPRVKELQQEIRNSSRVAKLLSERDRDGAIPAHSYAKWYGAHWILVNLADIGYPPNDETLMPLWDDVCGWLLSREHQEKIRCIRGRVRQCASQEGNALFYALKLGLSDTIADRLADRLLQWQWPDGGWNCDKRPGAKHSSFVETLIPLRALALYGKVTGYSDAKDAVKRAAEVFLKRDLFRQQHNGQVISEDFVKLHYPCYWHYDILFGLKVMAEAGFINDPRCRDALELLQSKQLPDGGFPAEKKYYTVTDKKISGRSLVNWGGASPNRMNEFITADALFVLKEAGRLN